MSVGRENGVAIVTVSSKGEAFALAGMLANRKAMTKTRTLLRFPSLNFSMRLGYRKAISRESGHHFMRGLTL